MRRSLKKSMLWQGVGLLLYLVGMVLFLSVAVSLFLSPPENQIGQPTTADVVVLLASVAFIVFGRVINYKFGGTPGGFRRLGGPVEQESTETRLQQMGYKVPSESTNGSDSKFTFENGEVYVVCPNCGTKNESDFRFCGNCSTELPD